VFKMLTTSTILPWVWICTIWICTQHIQGILGTCSDNSKTNWKNSTENYPLLIELFKSRTKGELEPGSSTLKLVNWQDKVLRLACPDTPVNGEVEKWRLRYFSDPENEKTEELEEKFSKKDYEGWQLIVETPSAYEYFAVYSCLTEEDKCWHHFYVVTQPGPKTKFPIQLTTGSNDWFDCVSRSRNTGDDEEFAINSPLQDIHWIFPNGTHPDNVNITTTNRTLNGVNSYWNSTIEITGATDENAGLYECVIVDKFGVSSSPTFEGTHLPNGERYRAIAHVHVRPANYALIPLGIIGVQLLIIPLLVRFCKTAKGEADLEEEDTPPRASGSGPRRKLNSAGDENKDFELEKTH